MIQWDEKTDIVVIGSGAAGLSAAIEAHKAGASVVVFEKMKLTGGNTRISDGALSAAGNFLQKKLGVEDSPDFFHRDMLKAGLGLNQPHLARMIAEKGAEAVEWTRSELGVRYLDRLDRFGGHSAARSVTTSGHSGADLVKAQAAALKRAGVEIRTCCKMLELLSEETGRVRGVKIFEDCRFRESEGGGEINVRAGKAVILATGGFANDVAFRALQNPALDKSVKSTNHAGASAEAMGEAFKKGAAPVHLSWIQAGPWGCADEKGYGKGGRFASYSVFPCGILVDPADGRRIVNEWADRRTRSAAMFKAGHPCLGIVDARGAENEPESLRICLKSGKIKKFDSVKALADAFGVAPGRLEKTVERYNRIVKAGRADEFGKVPGKSAHPLDTPPFYCVRLWPKAHYTSGGVGIDSKARVIDIKGRPIPGLFAAGEVCGGIHGADRLGGSSLVECIVFGRIAGMEAAGVR